MTKEEKYEKLIEQFIERKELSVATIQIESKAGLKIATKVYQEWKKYHDEVFWHGCIYDISFMDEVPTPVRIMKEFDISPYFAQKLFEKYMEMI